MSARSMRWFLELSPVVVAVLAAPFAGRACAQDAAAPVASIAPRSERLVQVQADTQRGGAAGAPKRDAFAPHSWAPPPAPVAKPKPPPELHGPPPPPPPPPLALSYLGQLDIDGEPTVYYLAAGDRVFAVRLGDTIDGVYQLLARDGLRLTVMYLPLHAKQVLLLNPPRS